MNALGKRLFATAFATAAIALGCGIAATPAYADDFIAPIYRAYNSFDGQHFFTADKNEMDDLVAQGWDAEPIAWYAPYDSDTPVQRLHNPYTHEHLYTSDSHEVDALCDLGWEYEGVAWNSSNKGPVNVYRLYNEYADASSAHHYTTSANERDTLVALGWSDEGVGWQALQAGEPTPKKPGEDGYYGFQNPAGYFQVSCKSVDIPHRGDALIGYRTESRISANATREECIETAIARALEYLGTSYEWGYTNAPGVGTDCSGLVIQALYATGMDLSPLNPWIHYYTENFRTTEFLLNTAGFMKVPFEERERGDLIFYKGHVAIYLGNDQIIEAVEPVVRIGNVYARPVIGVRRVFIEN